MIDPLMKQAIDSGKMIAASKGEKDWRPYAKEVLICLKVTNDIIKNAVGGNMDDYHKLTFAEKAQISQEALKIVLDRRNVEAYAKKMGIH